MGFRTNIFMKIIILLFALLTPLILLYGYSNQVNKKVLQKEIESSNLHNLTFFLEQLDTNIEKLSLMSMTFLMIPDIKEFANLNKSDSSYHKIEVKKNIEEMLKVQSSLSNWESEIIIYSKEGQDAISTSNSILKKSWNFTNESKNQWDYRTVQYVNGIVENHFVRHTLDPLFSEFNNAGLIAEVNFSNKNIIEMLNQLKSTGDGDPFFYNPNYKPIINNEADQVLIEDLVHVIHNNELMEKGTISVKLKKENYLVLYAKSSNLDWYLIDYVPLDDLMAPITRSRNLFYTSIAILIFLAIIATLILYYQVQLPIRKLIDHSNRVKSGNYSTRIQHNSKDEFNYLIRSFNSMVEKIQELIEKVYIEKIRTREATLKQLQAQINPHFLYNSLYFINNMAEMGNKKAVTSMALSLGEYFRYTTRVENQMTRLESEINFIKSYLRIQKLRKGSLNYTIQISEELLEQEVPRLILQPIIENAIIHGVDEKLGPGNIIVVAEQDESDFILIVDDNGVGMISADIEKLRNEIKQPLSKEVGCGLWNVNQRLSYRFGKAYGLEITHSPLGGLRVVLHLKKGSV